MKICALLFQTHNFVLLSFIRIFVTENEIHPPVN